jgi:hypothetical protein
MTSQAKIQGHGFGVIEYIDMLLRDGHLGDPVAQHEDKD